MNYHPFGGVHPVVGDADIGSLNRDGVQYRWIFRNGKLYAGVWVTERTWAGYHYQLRVK